MDQAMRLGVLEKAILSIICKEGVHGRQNIEKNLKIVYLLAEKKFPDKSFQEALKRLAKKGLIYVVGQDLQPMKLDWDLIREYKKHYKIFLFFNILRPTEEGMKIAEKLPKPEEIILEATAKQKIKRTRKEMLQQIHEIASQLIEKQGYVTASQIKQTAWEKHRNQYKNREEFEKTWSEKRIGRFLKKLGFKLVRKGKKRERFWADVSSKIPFEGNFSINIRLSLN